MNKLIIRAKLKEPFMEKNKQTIQLDTQDLPAVSRRSFMANTTLLAAGLAVGPSTQEQTPLGAFAG